MYCIIPAAGIGTRFLPFTKVVPKELVPLFDTPAIDFIVREIIQNDLFKIKLVLSPAKQILRHYFETQHHLEAFLKKNNKLSLLARSTELHATCQVEFPLQKEALGLGHAILQAETDDPLTCIVLPDELLFAQDRTPALLLKKMIQLAKEQNAHVIAVKEIQKSASCTYGMIAHAPSTNADFLTVEDVVEKPNPEHAPSTYAIIGRYILKQSIFNALRLIRPGFGNELQLTDGIKLLLQSGEKVLALPFDQPRFDIGNPDGWFECLNFIKPAQK